MFENICLNNTHNTEDSCSSTQKKIEYVKGKHLETKLPLDLFKFSALKVYYEEDAELVAGLIRTLFKLNYLADRALTIL